jgi:adenylate kinase family enzyme
MKNIYLIRGCPGSGKTTVAETLAFMLGAPVYSADQYFESAAGYKFDMSKIGNAHASCQTKTEKAMELEYPHIFVANTFTREKEMKVYFELAETYGYRIFSLIVENKHNGKNVHNVPKETLDAMKARFQITL